MAKISLRTIDYFKFKNLVIDRQTDDSDRCSREVQALCEGVARINGRTDSFDPVSDRQRLDEVCGYYKLILEQRRVIPLDVRLKSGWWGGDRNAYSAGKLKASALRETLLQKAREWATKNGLPGPPAESSEMEKRIDGPGVFVFKHRENRCFQLVGRSDRIFSTCSENLKASFEGAIAEPLAALLVTSLAQHWNFYFIPVGVDDDETIQCILENDTVLKHDSIWPYGLNFRLNISSFLCVDQLRLSCLRHGWPPERKRVQEGELYLNRLRLQVNEACNAFLALDTFSRHPTGPGGAGSGGPSLNSDLLSSLPSTPSLLGSSSSEGRMRDSTDRMSISSSSSGSGGESGSSSSLVSSITATTVQTAIQKKSTDSTSGSGSAKAKPDRSSSVGATIRRNSGSSRSGSQLVASSSSSAAAGVGTQRKEAKGGGSSLRSRSASHNGSQRSSIAAPKRLSVESSPSGGQPTNGAASGSNSPLSTSSSPVVGGSASSSSQGQQWRPSWECPRSCSKTPKK